MADPSKSSVSLDDALRSVADVDGWMTPGQAGVLFEHARRCLPGQRIVEIGSFQGRSTIVLALGSAPGVELVAIDPHAGNDRGPQELDGFGHAANTDHARFVANLARAGVSNRVRHVREFSDRALSVVEGDLALLYIDGAHRYAPARADIESWGARVHNGGTMLIHDSFSSIGVTAAIARSLALSREFRYVGRSRSLAIFRRETVTRGARLVNAARLSAQVPWFFTNVALKVLLSVGGGRLWQAFGRSAPAWPY